MTEPEVRQAAPGQAPLQPRPWRAAADQARAGAALPEWAAEWRSTALARLDATGLPDGTGEDWRYTSLARYGQRWSAYLAGGGQPTDPRPAAPAPDPARMAPGQPTLHVRVVDGALRVPPGASPPGLHIASLRDLPPALRARAEALVRKAAGSAAESLVDLNSALVTDVIVVATDAGSCHDGTPVHIHLESSGAPAFGQPRVIVDVARDSRLALIIEHSGANGSLANAVTQAWVAGGAHLNLVRLQCLPDDGMLTETSNIELATAATAQVTSVDLGALLCRHSMTILLAGANASATVDGLFLADGSRHVDNRTRLEHRAPGTTSRESFRGLADGHGRGVFNGKIIVYPGAQGSNAALTNRNLLLATTAEIDTKPELEIYVDDVRCSHGATTGQLDAAALFYLRSRGLDAAAARQVLTAAFLREPLASIAAPEVRARLEARLQQMLGGDAAIAGPGGAA